MLSTDSCADRLNGLLRGEISAVETYGIALEGIANLAIRKELEDVQNSHLKRVESLSTIIERMGKKPAASSGVWGSFAKIMEGGMRIFGEKATIDVLEQGEDKGLADYQNLMREDSPELRMVVNDLLQAQENSHEKMSKLKHQIH